MSSDVLYPGVQLRRSSPPIVGPVVLSLQQRLAELGHACADIRGARVARTANGAARADIAGVFGRRTATAVAEFQRGQGLVADGIVGPRTWSSLFGAKAAVTSRPQTAPPQPAAAPPASVAEDSQRHDGSETHDPRFGEAIKFVLGWEGGFVDDPHDRGGRTNKGVTAAVYHAWLDRKNLPRRDVKLITDREVHQLYFDDYWLSAKCDQIGDPIGLVQFDTAINMGVGRAVRFLQAAVRVPVDGRFGAGTRAACAACDVGDLLTRYCDLREAFYRRLATKPNQGKFLKGWLNRLNDLRRRIGLARTESADVEAEWTAKAGELELWEEELIWEAPDSPDLVAAVGRLEELAAGNDQEALEAAADALLRQLRADGTRLTYARGAGLLQRLRAARRFALMERVADALIQTGCDGTAIRTQYAQALIDGGKLAPAIDLLERLAGRTRGGGADHVEVCGLLGRAWKQAFVSSGASPRRTAGEALEKSLAAYHEALAGAEGDARWWPAINLVALAARARGDGLEAAVPVDTMAVAQEIVAALALRTDLAPWDLATLAEANLALGRWDEGERLIRAYVADPRTDAFMLGGTLRQLVEIWRLDRPGTAGADLVQVLKAELLRREGGTLALTPAALQALEATPRSAFERVLGEPGMVTWQWMRTGLARAAAVAIVRQPDGRGVGTGFLVRGDELAPDLGDGPFLLTNAHVVSPNPADRPAVPFQDARIVFEAAPERPAYGVAEVVWSSPADALDATLLRLDGAPPVEPCPIFAGDLPDPAAAETAPDAAKLYIIGHPLGGELSFSIQDNKLLDHEGPAGGTPSRPGRVLVHYRTPTEPGSSGSPVFDPLGWRVLALHHAGGAYLRRLNGKPGTYAANEGIWIGSIRKALAVG